MKIVRESDVEGVPFRDLNQGDTFFTRLDEKVLLMKAFKIDSDRFKTNSVSLSTGYFAGLIEDDIEVFPVEARIVISQ